MSSVDLHGFLTEHVQKNIAAYDAQPALIEEHWNDEQSVISGGYAHRQIIELIQNGADEIKRANSRGRIWVKLTDSTLYCANEGQALGADGIKTLLMSGLSAKTGDEIGRFGLGFKSILKVCDSPEFYSSEISFRFGGKEHLDRIAELAQANGIPTDTLPRLRTAELCSLRDAMHQDAVLSSLMKWATTVIRLPLTSVPKFLVEELQNFPAEFLLFSPHVSELRFEFLDSNRTVSLNESNGEITLRDGEKKPRNYVVFKDTIDVAGLSDDVRADMDDRLKKREALPISWAAPIDGGQRERGKFWAFFPTHSLTSVQGIVNAPWKTNSDRQNLVEDGGNEFNAEVARRVAKLIADNLCNIANDEDDAKHIDLLPLTETNGKTDDVLHLELKRLLQEREWVPCCGGTYATPKQSSLRPAATLALFNDDSRDYIGQEADELVVELAESESRRKILGRFGVGEMPVEEWLVGLKYNTTLEFSQFALLIAELLVDEDSAILAKLRQTEFVLCEDGTLAAPNPQVLVFPGESVVTGVKTICRELAMDQDSREILRDVFEIDTANANSAFFAHASQRSSVRRYSSNWESYWETFWDLLRQSDISDPQIREICLDTKHPLRVRSLWGNFVSIFDCIILPELAAKKGIESVADRICDPGFHSDDNDVFESLGLCGLYRLPPSANRPQIFSEYKQECVKDFRREHPGAKQESGCIFVGPTYRAGLDLLKNLTGEAAVFFTETIGLLDDYDKKWRMAYDRKKKNVGDQQFESPYLWLVRQYGWVNTSKGIVRLSVALSPRYRRFEDDLPIVAEDSPFRDMAKSRESEIAEILQEYIHREAELRSSSSIGELYGLAAKCGVCAPAKLWANCDGWELHPPTSVFVASDRSQLELLQSQNLPFLQCLDAGNAEDLCRNWKVLRPAIQTRFIEADASIRAREQFPNLAGTRLGEIHLQPCTELSQELRNFNYGLSTFDVTCCFNEGVFYYLQSSFNSLSGLLEAMLKRFPEDKELIEQTRVIVAQKDTQALVASIRECPLLEEKLLLAIGDKGLASNLPGRHVRQVKAASNGSLDSVLLARASLAVYGPDILKNHREELTAKGLDAPRQWAGRTRELEFVRTLGFPDTFAGVLRTERPVHEDIMGPVSLPQLHPYQRTIKSQVLDFLNSPEPQRAVVSLPTGSGKTRLAVQSTVEWMSECRNGRSVLWIAQSDELCEQAVQSWKQAWAAFGSSNTPMRIGRCWGDRSSGIEVSEGHTVVVASYQTLRNRVTDNSSAWLFDNADCVIVDEAHGAIAPSYTSIFKRLGIAGSSTRLPLLGLTATPFRGSNNEAESHRLATRFYRNLITGDFSSSEEFYRHLQSEGILAYAEHERLEGVEIDLTETDREHVDTFGVLPKSIEARLAGDLLRNKQIIERLKQFPSDWPVLVFGASREHAEDLAVTLSIEGITARCVSGLSSINQRRTAIREFNEGGIRVLTNYGVLTTGFDAPALRAIVIARPIFSKVLYQQVVGRGLRGPKNGGKETCSIVNIADNTSQHGLKLAFEAEEYWEQGAEQLVSA